MNVTERGANRPRSNNWLRQVGLVGLIAAFAAAMSIALSAGTIDAARSDQIIVRAQGSTGTERLVLHVNGQKIAQWTVSTSMTPYEVTVSEDTAVSDVEVEFTNDNGARDLVVEHVNIAGTVLKSNDPSTTSTGTYVSSDGGCKSRSSTSNKLHCDGSFIYAVPDGLVLTKSPNEEQIVVRARGKDGTERLSLRVNGAVVVATVVGTEWKLISVPVDGAIESVEVHFVNDAQPRDLQVDYLEVAGRRLQSEGDGTRSTGTYANGSCAERVSTSEWLHCNGGFVYDVGDDGPEEPDPPQSTTTVVSTSTTTTSTTSTSTTTTTPTTTTVVKDNGDRVQVRALGRSGTESMQLRIDGQAVETWTVTTSMASYAVTVPDAEAIETLEVRFLNDNGTRDLRVDYVDVDGTRYQSESSTTRSSGTYTSHNGCSERDSTSEWLHCTGWFRYPVSGDVTDDPDDRDDDPDDRDDDPDDRDDDRDLNDGRYSIAQVIDGTIGAGDGSNPHEESPMGRHEAPLYLPQGWNWAQGPSRNSVWGQLGTGGSRYVEWRCAVIPEYGHKPSVPFRINVRNGAYYQFANDSWQKGFDVDLTGGNHGGYLGQAGTLNNNPFSSGGHGQIQWRREADGSYSAPWNSNALMMHFWAGQRKSPASGQTAEFLTSEVRLQQPDGQTVDLSKVNVLFQCGVDYYNTTGGQGTKVPGPGIAKYNRVTADWRPGLWVTLPGNVPAGSTSDFRNWLESNPPPNVGN